MAVSSERVEVTKECIHVCTADVMLTSSSRHVQIMTRRQQAHDKEEDIKSSAAHQHVAAILVSPPELRCALLCGMSDCVALAGDAVTGHDELDKVFTWACEVRTYMTLLCSQGCSCQIFLKYLRSSIGHILQVAENISARYTCVDTSAYLQPVYPVKYPSQCATYF